jgi:type VI secretion system FHA domain protein
LCRPRQSSPSDRTGAATEGSLETLLKAAGVDDLEPTDELARTCGEILRVVVNGLMDVLRAREQLKEELRIRSTTFKPANNNPLKFSADAEDAFHNLLVKQNSAYLSPPEAFAEALQDIRDHQQAVHTALRFAFETMLAQFDPNRLQEEFDRQMKKGSILGVPAKLRYWDLYKDKYGAVVKDAEASFRTLFGNEFARAYEEHIERLKGRGRSR